MSWFKKEETEHYRDKKGNPLPKQVREVIHEPRIRLPERKTSTYDSLMDKYYKDHPEKTKSARVKKAAVGLGKRIDTWSKNYSKNQKGSGPMFTWNTPPSSKSSGKAKPPMALEFFNFGKPSGTSHKKTGKSSGEKYIIRGGKAYKIAKTSTSKKSSVKKKKYDMNDPFDFPKW